jgi:rare lipoprotein A
MMRGSISLATACAVFCIPILSSISNPAGAQVGLASFYRYGGRTANGERFNANALTAAHRTLKFGTRVRVTHLNTGRSVIVRINDRGPFVGGRIIDLSYGAAKAVGLKGTSKVNVVVLE